MITDLLDYLNNNLLIAHYCGFDITRPLLSYWTFDRFLKGVHNQTLSDIMKSQVLSLAKEGFIDTSFIGLDSTPVVANTSQNNPESFLSNKFNPDHQPKADRDCKLGVHTASNQTGEKKYDFYRGYKNHVLVDCISGLPIYEMTTTANVYDSAVALDILADTHAFLPVIECTFLADKGYKNFYNGKKHRGCTKYVTIPDDLRLSVDRNSNYFKSNYSLRTECERYNSRFKNTGQERMWVRNQSSATNLNTLAHISLLAVAVAVVTTQSGQSYRKLKTVKRTA
ncbi:MAG: transposase [Eubacteriales bacterium]|nr:transposase [Eubacteriales bacterium]